MENKKVLVICDGLLPSYAFIKESIKHHDFTIACDGAANHLLHHYIQPNLIIGDLDSFDESLHNPSLFVIKDSNQETNDLEKALFFALNEGYKQVEIIGALGKRIDHTLKNLSVMLQFNPHFEWLYMRDEFGISFIAGQKTELKTEIGTVISLIPISGKVEGIQTEGLKYPLHNEWLENGKRDGTSNENIDSQVIITKTKGELLLFVAHQTHQPADFITRSAS